MLFKIVGPTKTETLSIHWFQFASGSISYTVLEGHAPMITALDNNSEITFELMNGSKTVLTITAAILEIDRHEALLIITN